MTVRHSPTPSRRGVLKSLATGSTAVMLASPMVRRAFAAGPAVQTIEKGVITAACLGEMPLTGERDGKLIGTDLELLSMIADRLGLRVKMELMGFPAVLEAVQAGRADWLGGNLAWTPTRTRIVQLTNPVFYTGAYVIMRESEPLKGEITVEDFKGRTIGSGTGYSFVPEMKKLPDIKEVKLYDGNDPCLRDIAAGRLDFAVLDAPIIDYVIKVNPDFKLKQVPIKFDASYPTLTSKFGAVWAVPPQNATLLDALNQGLAWLHRTGQVGPVLAKYGITNPDYLVPLKDNKRLGVDRDKDGSPIGPFGHTPSDFSSVFS